MTTSISTGSPVPTSVSPGTGSPGGVTGAPGEAQLRGVPAAASGLTGGAPSDVLGDPSGFDAADAGYYFVQVAQTSSPQVLPLLNIAPPGAEPPLGYSPPALSGAADPRGLPGRTAAPGQHLGSTAPATPLVELGAQPFAPAIPPLSGFAVPTERSARSAPGVVAGATKANPVAIAPGAGSSDLPYFLQPGTHERAVANGPLYFLEEIHVAGVSEQGFPAGGIRPELGPKPR